jgi:hypothetical protein
LRSSDIIEQYQLSKENYDFPLFHHPPFFVYFSSFLHYHCSFPLPFISVLYQLVVLVLFIPLSYLLLSDSLLKRNWLSVAWKAMIMWMICPIAAFCSQKFWIDNALVMTVMIGIIFFLSFHKWILFFIPTNLFFLSSFLCGFFSLILPLNTKITSVGLLPFMLIYHFWTVAKEITKRKNSSNLSKSFATSVYCCWSLLLGCSSSYLPWLSVYYLNTGRMLPSAIPSLEMLEKYPFVLRAVMKPWYTYLISISSVSPLHAFGMCSFVVVGLRYLYQLVPSLVLKREIVKKETRSSEKDFLCEFKFEFESFAWIGFLPLSFILFLTILGGGYQTRFILPVLPFSCFITSVVAELLCISGIRVSSVCFSALEIFCLLCCIYSAVLMFYYGTLFSISYADLEYSLNDIVFQILSSPFRTSMVNSDFHQLLAHYGVIRN